LGVSNHLPWDELPEEFRKTILHGNTSRRGKLTDKGFQGVYPFLKLREKKRYKQYIRVFLRQYQSPQECSRCGGSRLREEALHVRVAGRSIARLARLPLEELREWLEGLHLEGADGEIAGTILKELSTRVAFLIEVGLGYLNLDRQARTLSGGEAQRINLANSLGSSLVDAIYVLDEPSIGLHSRDTEALLRMLGRLRDIGNTVLIVEHDSEAIRSADHVIELGPASGEKGGEVVFQGTPKELLAVDTVTGRFLSGRSGIPVPKKRRRPDGGWITLRGAELHNVRDVDLEIPLDLLVSVTGVSGSGKSTLIHDILYRALERELAGGESSAREHLGESVGSYRSLAGHSQIDEVVLIDQSPIGRTPRSNPVTYVKAWDEIRKLFASRPSARERGYTARHFSFNVTGGRCEACKGAGEVEVEMVFMADVFLPCEFCRGKRFRPEVLEVQLRGKNVAEVLNLTADEAIRFFSREDRIGEVLWHLQEVGLGYLRLGQAATTLSGGEAQRLKIARELAGASGRKGRKLYLLDEPTTGLAGEDVKKLLEVLHRLVRAGNTVLVIEHNLEVVKVSDWVIDVGPGAGECGGEIVVAGTPEAVAAHPGSHTGRFLRGVLECE
jgi:excinuclease ABC subunit A